MEDLIWCFTIRDAETNEIFGSDKKSPQNTLINTIGTHTLKVTLRDIKLLPGKYLLSGEATTKSGALFMSYSNKRPFYVSLDEFRGTGVYYIPHTFENS